jgi:DNA-binding NarL/FixJ family response regulator
MSARTEANDETCAVCDASPTVLVGIRHRAMRRLTIDLLAAEHGCWAVEQPGPGELLAGAIARSEPDLVVVDSVDFPACCQAALRNLPPERVVVIGPEPDAGYRRRALALGAASWICRDHIGEQLSTEMRAALGCRHAPCRSASARAPSERCPPTPSPGVTQQ